MRVTVPLVAICSTCADREDPGNVLPRQPGRRVVERCDVCGGVTGAGLYLGPSAAIRRLAAERFEA